MTFYEASTLEKTNSKSESSDTLKFCFPSGFWCGTCRAVVLVSATSLLEDRQQEAQDQREVVIPGKTEKPKRTPTEPAADTRPLMDRLLYAIDHDDLRTIKALQAELRVLALARPLHLPPRKREVVPLHHPLPRIHLRPPQIRRIQTTRQTCRTFRPTTPA